MKYGERERERGREMNMKKENKRRESFKSLSQMLTNT
jgi:hypothetical protein